MALFIGQNIKYLCVKNSLTESEFGELFGQKGGTINTYTGGRSFPKPDVIQKICAHFGISIDDFFNVDMSKEGDLATMGRVQQLREPGAEYFNKNKIIEAQEKTIKAYEDQIEYLKRDNENLRGGAQVS